MTRRLLASGCAAAVYVPLTILCWLQSMRGLAVAVAVAGLACIALVTWSPPVERSEDDDDWP